MYLVDTNVWLERLLDQQRAEEVGAFLGRVAAPKLFITEFSVHSIGVILTRGGLIPLFTAFVREVLAPSKVRIIVQADADFLLQIANTVSTLRLDFDDALQYTAAETYDLTLVSFDSDFDRTPRGRKTPREVEAGH